jgi:hypothetical protein
MNEKLKTFLSKIKVYIIAFIGVVVSIITSFFIGKSQGKNISDNRNRTDNARKQLSDIQTDSERLRDTNKSTEKILSGIRKREQKNTD